MCFGPHAKEIGKFEARQRLTVVRRLCGHDPIGPRGVLVQSIDRTTLPISPAPASELASRVSLGISRLSSSVLNSKKTFFDNRSSHSGPFKSIPTALFAERLMAKSGYRSDLLQKITTATYITSII